MKKRLKIVDEFSKNKKENSYQKIDRNIFYENYKNGTSGRICLRKICPITKKIYNKAWSLCYYSYNDAIYEAKRNLDFINMRAKLGLPLKYYCIQYWVTPTTYKLI